MGNEQRHNFGPKSGPVLIDPILPPLESELSKAKTAIDRKCAQLRGAPGAAIGPVVMGTKDGFRRDHQNGVMFYLPPASPCWVQGAILQEYLSLGGDGGSLGFPTTDELIPQGGAGRYPLPERVDLLEPHHGRTRSAWSHP